MLRTGKDYIESLRDGREVWIDGERVGDVPTPPGVRAGGQPPRPDLRPWPRGRHRGPADLHRRGVGRALRHHLAPAAYPRRLAGQAGVGRRHPRRRRRRGHPGGRRDRRRDVVAVRRAGRAERDRPAFSANIAHHVRRAQLLDPFHVSANTDPKGNRSVRPQDQDPDVLLHVVGETDKRHRGARRQVRDRGRLRQPGVRQADHRRVEQRGAQRLRGRLPRRHGRAGHQAHLPVRLRRRAQPGRLPADQQVRRDRHDDRLRQRGDPVGERLLLPAHQGGRVHPRDPAPLQHLPVRPALRPLRRLPARRGLRERQVDRRHDAPGRAGEDRADRVLPRGHQRAPDRGDRARASPARAGCSCPTSR